MTDITDLRTSAFHKVLEILGYADVKEVLLATWVPLGRWGSFRLVVVDSSGIPRMRLICATDVMLSLYLGNRNTRDPRQLEFDM